MCPVSPPGDGRRGGHAVNREAAGAEQGQRDQCGDEDGDELLAVLDDEDAVAEVQEEEGAEHVDEADQGNERASAPATSRAPPPLSVMISH